MGIRFYKTLVRDNMKGRQTKFLLDSHDISGKSGKSKDIGMHRMLCCCCLDAKLCSTLCNLMDYSTPGSLLNCLLMHLGILKERNLFCESRIKDMSESSEICHLTKLEEQTIRYQTLGN